jgi:hypothetical protein
MSSLPQPERLIHCPDFTSQFMPASLPAQMLGPDRHCAFPGEQGILRTKEADCLLKKLESCSLVPPQSPESVQITLALISLFCQMMALDKGYISFLAFLEMLIISMLGFEVLFD